MSNAGFDEDILHPHTGYASYELRILFLKGEAEHDGYSLNHESETDFRQFISSAPEKRKGNLVLMDNGNLRAIWKDKQGTQLGLQFLGGGMVQYVIFKQREQGQPARRVLDGIPWREWSDRLAPLNFLHCSTNEA